MAAAGRGGIHTVWRAKAHIQHAHFERVARLCAFDISRSRQQRALQPGRMQRRFFLNLENLLHDRQVERDMVIHKELLRIGLVGAGQIGGVDLHDRAALHFDDGRIFRRVDADGNRVPLGRHEVVVFDFIRRRCECRVHRKACGDETKSPNRFER
jgi:hypothetical protein